MASTADTPVFLPGLPPQCFDQLIELVGNCCTSLGVGGSLTLRPRGFTALQQIGNVIIHDDVEIGSNASIDRGALGSTVIGQGTKIDNLVHVAHNVVMGKHCLIMGQVGFAGSTVLADYVVIASQSGIAGHLKLGAQATIGAKSGVMRDISAGETVLGYPAAPNKQAKRQWIAMTQLPDALRRLKTLEKRMNGTHEA